MDKQWVFFVAKKHPRRRRRRRRQGGGWWVRFFVAKKMLSAPFLTPAETKILVLLSASVETFRVPRMGYFFGLVKLKAISWDRVHLAYWWSYIGNDLLPAGLPVMFIYQHCHRKRPIVSLFC